jgi:hypothetical protein
MRFCENTSGAQFRIGWFSPLEDGFTFGAPDGKVLDCANLISASVENVNVLCTQPPLYWI